MQSREVPTPPWQPVVEFWRDLTTLWFVLSQPAEPGGPNRLALWVALRSKGSRLGVMWLVARLYVAVLASVFVVAVLANLRVNIYGITYTRPLSWAMFDAIWPTLVVALLLGYPMVWFAMGWGVLQAAKFAYGLWMDHDEANERMRRNAYTRDSGGSQQEAGDGPSGPPPWTNDWDKEAAIVDNAFATLGLQSDESPEQVRLAYLRAITAHHPDRFAHRGEAERRAAEERAKDITAAYTVLIERQLATR